MGLFSLLVPVLTIVNCSYRPLRCLWELTQINRLVAPLEDQA